MTSTVNPTQVVVTAAISFHTALKAISEFAEKYPVERLSYEQIVELDRATARLRERLASHVDMTTMTAEQQVAHVMKQFSPGVTRP